MTGLVLNQKFSQTSVVNFRLGRTRNLSGNFDLAIRHGREGLGENSSSSRKFPPFVKNLLYKGVHAEINYYFKGYTKNILRLSVS